MKSQVLFIVKLLIVSAVLSVVIKFAPISVPATATNALVAVLLPATALAIIFLLRYANLRQQKT